MEKKKRPQSHGMSHEQINELQQDQLSGDVSVSEANKDSSVKIPDHERHLVHARIETKTFDAATGEKLSTPFIQTFYPNEFAQMETDSAFIGKSVEIIHEPESLKKLEQTTKSTLDDPDSSKTKKEAVKKETAKKEVAAKKGKKVETEVIPLEKQPRANLLIEYKKLWNEDADPNISDEELIEAIKDKQPKA